MVGVQVRVKTQRQQEACTIGTKIPRMLSGVPVGYSWGPTKHIQEHIPRNNMMPIIASFDLHILPD